MNTVYNFDMFFPKITVEDDPNNENHKTFIINPLESGFGITLGNALRRISLSSLPGGGVKKIIIKGVNHEYDVIPSAKEDVTQVILALKNLAFKIDAEQDAEFKLTLSSNKKGELLAKDIVVPNEIEIKNPDLKIVTLSEDKEFSMEIFVQKGRGYSLADENRDKEKKAREIYVDSIYTPVEKFAYHVEDTRVGDKTNFDKLVIDIMTNGMLAPEDVLSYSGHILKEHALLIENLEETLTISKVFNEETMKAVEEESVEVHEPKTSIESLDISNRAYNGLKRAGINNIEELIQKSKKEILTLDNIGMKTVEEIEKQLEELGFKFKDE